MSIFKNKAKKISEVIAKFPHNIEATRNTIQEGRKFSDTYFQGDSALLNALEQNFSRLIERYKYDEKKVAQILIDSVEYCNIIDESVISRGIDHSEYDEIMKPLWIKMEEIDIRFKALLGEQYVDARKLLKQ